MASPIGKYAPLHTYLVGQTAKAVVLSFYSVEQILGFKLPLSARHRREWWGNENQATTRHTHSLAWALAGRKANPNLGCGTVTFSN